MRVVYVDVLFVSNLAVNYLLLLTTARVGGVYARRRRLLLGAALGAVFSVLLYFPRLSVPAALVIKIFLCGAIASVTFSREKHIFRISAVFVAISFAFAGGILALSTLTGSMAVNNGVPYFDISLRFLLVATVVVYCMISLVLGGGGFRAKKQTVEIRLCDRGRILHIKGLSDSGNLLRDPISGRPVLIVSASQARVLFEPEEAEVLAALTRENLLDSFSLLAALRGGTFRVIPYKTAAEGSGMLLTAKIESVFVDGKPMNDYLLGISPVEIQTKDGCRAIIGV